MFVIITDQHGTEHLVNTDHIVRVMAEPNGKLECAICLTNGGRIYMSSTVDDVTRSLFKVMHPEGAG